MDFEFLVECSSEMPLVLKLEQEWVIRVLSIDTFDVINHADLFSLVNFFVEF